MIQKSLFWKLFPSFVTISLAALVIVALIAGFSFRSFYYEKAASDLGSRTELAKGVFKSHILKNQMDRLQIESQRLGRLSQTRLTVILPNGVVVGDSHENPQNMDNHQNRPEFQAAYQNGQGMAIRYSHTIKKDFIYVASLIKSDSEVIGIIRAAMPLTALQQALHQLYMKIGMGCFFLTLAIAMVSWLRAARISQPLETVRVVAQQIANGNFSHRLDLGQSVPFEIHELEKSINDLSVQLKQRIDLLTTKSNEQEALFASMLEGVIALDHDGKVKHINGAAIQILQMSGLEERDFTGKNVQEIIRIPNLQDFFLEAIKSTEPSQSEIVILAATQPEKILQVKASPLKDGTGTGKAPMGTVIVLHDVTKLKALENHRRDFVANVSHELRTPLTSIQGYAETLLNPSVTDQKERLEFLKIIYRQCARLGTIVEDLLSLSRIEQEVERNQIEFQETTIAPILETAVEACKGKEEARDMDIRLECPMNLTAKVNSPLLEQAVINLIDNSLKYRNGSTAIDVAVNQNGKLIEICVSDQGMGISEEHLPRLFERFYRVDKARSRKFGGSTGLGLAIVKHIALAHRGNVKVQSKVGVGSRFTIQIPS